MDSLKLKAHEMLKTGHQSNAVAETQEVFNKFDQISDKVKVIYLITLIFLYLIKQ